ncbi:PleD family two-component system response regulator [Kordiimonas sp. SCSIO 12610]|uniref:PleD family two-component system response regulator n=1 Tax=Kordiimonas sp. SCSIO 12610 TaxID=2829597 RepID=UPI00210C8478|nr:PleD family two-component system response regulator [Kordiimonas sp. SCSIO 12610]UTW54261.1 PleD family two-component system response regulator [Kordiimonas sp. SCSIO 12610]
MTARVLVVDDVPPNVKLLEAKLNSEYFDVLTAYSGPEALDIIAREHPDIVLLDVMMPGMDGFEVCRRIKSDAATAHIPVIMVTALDQPSDRVAGLEAGADDFLTKPVQDLALFARVKSLVRLKVMLDELRNREATGANMGWENPDDNTPFEQSLPTDASILIVDEQERVMERIARALGGVGSLTFLNGGDDVADRAREKNFDLIIVSLTMRNTDGLRVCSKLRTFEETRHVPILVMVDDGNSKMLVRALEMGVNDYVVRPVDRMEFLARVKTQLKRKEYSDKLWEKFHVSMQLATTDAVTGLYNRHYLTSHMETRLDTANIAGKPLSVLMMDIDHFKAVNDTYGHAAGDMVLKEFANRIAKNIRGVDLAARYGGEEFVVMMPETATDWATMIGDRLRQEVCDHPFDIGRDHDPITITVSIGVATSFEEDAGMTPGQLLESADKALYKAKEGGRNRVIVAN